MKILTVCQRGNCRSVAAAYILKDRLGSWDTIAMGIQTASDETQDMLFLWADRIIVCAGEDIFLQIPEKFKHKTYWANIGNDIWRNPMNEYLQAQLYPLLKNIIQK